MSVRGANAEDLEQLAKLMDGPGGLKERLDEAFTRAAQLGATGQLSPLKPMACCAEEISERKRSIS